VETGNQTRKGAKERKNGQQQPRLTSREGREKDKQGLGLVEGSAEKKERDGKEVRTAPLRTRQSNEADLPVQSDIETIGDHLEDSLDNVKTSRRVDDLDSGGDLLGKVESVLDKVDGNDPLGSLDVRPLDGA
jgi:hypothetical protein